MADTEPLELHTRPGDVPDSTVISISGRLVMEHIFRFQEVWRSVQSAIVIFDFAGVIYADSCAIGSLVNADVHFSRNGRKMALAAVPERVKHLLAVTKVDTVLQLRPTVAEAEAALAASGARA